MLGEGFLTVLTYGKESKDSSPQNRNPQCTKHAHKTKLNSMALTLIKDKEELPGLEQGQEQTRPSQPSLGVLIPSDTAGQHPGLELYHSWDCTSFCQDYPDLQLRGDHMVDQDSESITVQYAWGRFPLQAQALEELEALQPGPAPLRLKADFQPPQDDGYLEMDSSITLEKREPLSNSMLNCYLESKLLEVYRQHLQDSLARLGFPANPAQLPNVLLPSVNQLSRQLSHEQGLDASVALNVVTHYLSSMCTRTGSSHFSSPVLRISNADERKKPPSLSKPL
ncbi:TLR adapter interacting with SLC15A4 on the lysosome [Conger conger]|uniref:TLR adapter interacting with SLC15A4 on the lysosome n=1 Tax=Conger conger TaxID=82655 RepID=UPI002A5AEDE4|nr:TLR adapter interacting with SLC15A4 on the lysosome [Conger conger]